MADRYETDVAWPLPQEPTAAERAAFLQSRKYRNVGPGNNRLEDVADALVPKEPWEYGLMALGPGAGLAGRALAQLPKAARVALGAAGITATASEAEAGNKWSKAGGASVDAVKSWLQKLGYNPSDVPANWVVRHTPQGPVLADASDKGAGGYHNLSALRTGLPLDEMGYKIKGAPDFQRNVKDIADYEGGYLIPTGVDRMRAGGKLTQIGETKLPKAVQMEGGIDYPWLQMGKKVPGQADDVTRIWANQQGPATGINRKAEEVLEKGGTPYLMPVTGAKGMGDSSQQLTSSALQAARQADLTPAAIKAIDEALPVKGAKIKGDPVRPYPGFASDELPDWLRDVSGPWRSAFVKSLDMKPVMKGGGPDIGQVRYANTDPRLVNTPTAAGGRMIAQMDPTLGTAPSLHSTYPAAMLGPQGGVGGLQGSVPFHLINPDIHRALLKAGPAEKFANKADYYSMLHMPTGVPKYQKVTPEVVDLVSEFFRKYPQGWAVGGAVPLAGRAAYEQSVGSQ